MNYKKQNMKYIKLYEEYTSGGESGHPGFLKTREETKDWLNSMKIKNYTIKEDLTVDVSGGVWIENKNLDYIPIQFGLVGGYFYCSSNNLTSLKGCPTEVSGGFYCHNNNLTSLEYCPIKVGVSFFCHNNNLTSLEHTPIKIWWSFYCGNNKLTSLKGCPTKVGSVFDCSRNNLTSLEHCPIEVDGDFDCENNIIVSEIPEEYFGENNPSWGTDDPELITSRFFDKIDVLDSDTKVDVLATLKKLEPEFYNSEAFQVYNPDSMIKRIQRSREATGGLFEL